MVAGHNPEALSTVSLGSCPPSPPLICRRCLFKIKAVSSGAPGRILKALIQRNLLHNLVKLLLLLSLLVAQARDLTAKSA